MRFSSSVSGVGWLRQTRAAGSPSPCRRRYPRVYAAYRAVGASWYGPGFYGRRTACGQTLTLEGRWHMHHMAWRVHGGSDALYNRTLMHANCHRQIHVQERRTEAAASREGR
jgi:hypothetical protein